MESLIAHIRQGRMGNAILLFLVGHRPLAFMLGQSIYLVAPLAAMLGFERLDEVARLLSKPEGVAWLERELQK